VKIIHRKQRSILNISLSLISQIIAVLAGMLLPRVLMTHYGSETNGMVSSIQQAVGYLTLIEGGLLSTVAVKLYKPLADGDTEYVNQILSSAKRYYSRTGLKFCIALICISAIYPVISAETQYSFFQTFLIVVLLGLNGATQICFIGKYKALLMAAQLNGIILAINAGSTALYAIILMLFANVGLGIVESLAIAVSAYLIRAIAFYVAVKKLLPQYRFDLSETDVTFPKRKEALATQILGMCALNGGMIVMTVCKAPMEQISVYSTYSLVLSALFMLTYCVENSVTSALGDISVRGDQEHLQKIYEQFDSLYQIFWTVLCSCLFALLLPFISVYTKGIGDALYVLPIESSMFACVGALWILRNESTLLLTAKGEFQAMRKSMLIETLLVVVLGCLLYLKWDLKGLLMAKIIATVFSFVSLTKVTYSKVLMLKTNGKLKRLLISCGCIAAVITVSNALSSYITISSMLSWVLYAGLIAVIAIFIVIAAWTTILRQETKSCFQLFFKKKR